MRPARFALIAGITAALIGGTVACSSSGGGSAGASGSSGGASSKSGNYVIGVDDLLSGPLALYGQPTLNWARAAAAYTNAHGGVNGHQVRVVSGDLAASGQSATSVATQLISSDHANVIVGSAISAYCGALAPIAASQKVPVICIGIPSNVAVPVQPYMFSGGPVFQQEADPALTFVKNTLKLPSGSRFATYSSDGQGALAWTKGVAAGLTAAGDTQASSEVVPLTAANGTTQIAQLVSSKPDIVFAGQNSSQIEALVRALRAADNKAPVIIGDGNAGYTTLQSIADPNVYEIDATKFITDLGATDTGAATAIAAMKQINQGTVDAMSQGVGSVTFPPIYAVIEAFKGCGYPCSGSSLQAQMDKTSVTLPGLVEGAFAWSSSSHLPFSTVYFYHYDTSTKQQQVAATVPMPPLSN